MSVTQGTQSPEHVDHYDSSLNTKTGENSAPCDELEPGSHRGLGIKRPEYKPVALRWPFLATVLAALVITFVLLISAIKTLPPMENHAKHPSRSVGPARRAPQAILSTISTGDGSDQTLPESLQHYSPVTTPIDHVAISTCVSSTETNFLTVTGAGLPGQYSQLGSQTVTIKATCQEQGIITNTVTLTADFGKIEYQTITITIIDQLTITQTDTWIMTTVYTTAHSDYGEIGYQTITTTMTDRETITKTVTETIREITRDTITETMIPLLTLPASHGDLETIWATKSLITVTSSVPRVDIDNEVDETITITYLALGSSKVTGSNICMGNSESVNVPGIFFNVGEQATSVVHVESQTSPTHSGSFGTALIDPNGAPITPSTSQASVVPIEPEGYIIYYIGDKISTLIATTSVNSGNPPIATLTISPDLVPSLGKGTKTDTKGHPTGTQIWTTMVMPSPSMEIGSNGVPTATILSTPDPPETYTIVYYIGPGQYFIGMFLPTITTSLIAIFVRIISINVEYFQPWHSLARRHGAFGRDSLFFQPGDWRSIFRSVRSVSSGEVVPFLANLLLVLSAVLIPLSAEAISLDLRGGCANKANTAKNCAWVLSTSSYASGASIVILVLLTFTLALLLGILRKWHLGVYTDPRSICTLASLSLNKEVQQLVARTETSFRDPSLLGCQNFELGYFQLKTGKTEYGIITPDEPNEVRQAHGSDKMVVPPANKSKTGASSKGQPSTKPFTLSYPLRLSLILMTSGVLVLVLYYSQTSFDTAFERFMDSDSFGVRFLFTSFGVAISFLWSSFFNSVAAISPYELLASRPQSANRSILLAPPTNPFSGLQYAARTRRPYLVAVCLGSVFSEFLGIFLSNIPFQVTQTFLVYQISIWMSVGILSFMVIIIVASFFIKWPYMIVDPRSIAGAIYYISDSPMLERFDGLSILKRKERDEIVMKLDLLYEFKEKSNHSDRVRMGINTSNRKGSIPL
ncbi:hypothetical protein F4803DRAFT_554013 [Xylaria telfairii]|nr:hypothetical protein F4803DRAFT_554013 [Xylaria telfairii]